MAKSTGKQGSRGQEDSELPDNTVPATPASSAPIIEADFSAPSGNASGLMAKVQSSESADTINPSDDLFAARDELLARLGGTAGLASAFSTATPDITGLENVVGVGVGFRYSGGCLTGDPTVKVFVKSKLPLSAISQVARIPTRIGGVDTDVEDVGEVVLHSWTARQNRPVKCGVSAGHITLGGSGTLGCMVILNNNKRAILSNNHVFAKENAAQIGDFIIQPGAGERVTGADEVIGVLEAFVPIQASGNTVDAAVAGTHIARVSPEHMTYKLNPTPMNAALGMTVMKNGRTTESTLGVITDLGFTVLVGYKPFPAGAGFVNQIVIRGVSGPFSKRGDSGSLVVTAGTKQPVGLLFSGSDDNSVTFANPIQEVIAKLGIREFVGG